jgi:Recombination endonuclease VII
MPRSSDGRWTARCEVCAREFQQKRPGARTCSRVCGNKLPHNTGGTRAKGGLNPRQCQNPECGKTYQPVRETQTSCSRECLLKTPQYLESQRLTDNRPERRAAQNRRRNLSTAPDADYRRFVNLRNNLRQHNGAEITIDQYQEWLNRQDGHCNICGRVAEGKTGHTDHDHVTGQLRDLLCGTCNQGLGCFKDDPALLRAAAEYIERHRAAVMLA